MLPSQLQRQNSILIPYKFKNGEFLVFLQKRSKDAKRAPDVFGFFGGGIEEGETNEQGLVRESQEELNYTPKNHQFFKGYDFGDNFKNIFLERVDDNFESLIKVQEGEYGKWFSKKEVIAESRMIADDRVVLEEIFNSFVS